MILGLRAAHAAARFHFANPAAGKSPKDLPPETALFIARAGRDEMPRLNDALDRFVTAAIACNLPITFANVFSAPHAFDVLHDSDTSRDAIRQILAFLQFHLAAADSPSRTTATT